MCPTDPSGGFPAPDDASGRPRRMELRRKVSLKFKEFQGFINEYSENISTGGMFIRTPSPQPPGTVFDFEFTLGDDYRLVHGIGEVVWVRERDEGFDLPAGMGIRFLSLDADSRKLIDRMVQERLDREARRTATAPSAMPRVGEPWGEMAPPGPPRTAPPLEPATGPEHVPPDAAPDALAPPPGALSEAPAAAEPEPEPDALPRVPGPSPYAYARSYRGAGVARPARRSRPLLVVLLAAFALVIVLAAVALFFPETALRWLVGGGGRGEATPVERARPPEGEAPPPDAPVTPVPRSEAEGVLGPVEPAEEERAGAVPEGEGAPDEAGEAPGEELGFFEPAPERPPAEAPRRPAPEPAEPPPPAPAPAAPTEPAPAEPSSVSRVLNVTWEPRGEELVVTVHLDGTLQEWDYSVTRIEVPPPRELVRIEGIERPFPRPTIPVGTDLVERIRIGFHPEARGSQIHLVLDLATPAARVDRSEASGTELRLHVVRGEG